MKWSLREANRGYNNNPPDPSLILLNGQNACAAQLHQSIMYFRIRSPASWSTYLSKYLLQANMNGAVLSTVIDCTWTVIIGIQAY